MYVVAVEAKPGSCWTGSTKRTVACPTGAGLPVWEMEPVVSRVANVLVWLLKTLRAAHAKVGGELLGVMNRGGRGVEALLELCLQMRATTLGGPGGFTSLCVLVCVMKHL